MRRLDILCTEVLVSRVQPGNKGAETLDSEGDSFYWACCPFSRGGVRDASVHLIDWSSPACRRVLGTECSLEKPPKQVFFTNQWMEVLAIKYDTFSLGQVMAGGNLGALSGQDGWILLAPTICNS